jgi:hypothetical protein
VSELLLVFAIIISGKEEMNGFGCGVAVVAFYSEIDRE